MSIPYIASHSGRSRNDSDDTGAGGGGTRKSAGTGGTG